MSMNPETCNKIVQISCALLCIRALMVKSKKQVSQKSASKQPPPLAKKYFGTQSSNAHRLFEKDYARVFLFTITHLAECENPAHQGGRRWTKIEMSD